MRQPNVTRMRKVNMAVIDEVYPVRYVLGLPVGGEIPDFTPGAMWTLPAPDVHTRAMSKARHLDLTIKRHEARKAWGFPA